MHVKLNNPLMGTETSGANSSLNKFLYVKLNNPLMGTETKLFCSFCLRLIKQTVKLNNPLMGTETLNILKDMIESELVS